MADKKDKVERLERELIAAHRREVDLDLGPAWRQNLMDDIRREPTPQRAAKRTWFEVPEFGRLVTRFAGATAALAVVFAVVALYVAPDLNDQVVRLAAHQPAEFFSGRLLIPFSVGL